MSVAQQFADAGHSLLVAHLRAHERLPLASAKHTDPALQQTEPHARSSAQHAPPTHVIPSEHGPVGFAEEHGIVGVTHAPPVHDCPLGHAPVGLVGLHGPGDGSTQSPPEHTRLPPHAFPHDPQFARLLSTSAQTPLHTLWPAPHVTPPPPGPPSVAPHAATHTSIARIPIKRFISSSRPRGS